MSGVGAVLWDYVGLLGSVYLLCLVFYAAELVAPAERGQPASKRLMGLAYLPLILFLSVLVLQPAFNWLYSHVLRSTGGGVLPELVGPQSGAAAHLLFALFFALVWDVWSYWLHRLQHAVPCLWETHKFHHGETALNSSTHIRQHFLHYLLALALYLPVLLLFGSQSPHFAAAFVMFRLWGFVNHANVRLDLGWLTPIISGPQWHRIHHSINAEHHDKNLATFFPFIDLLFGTYYRPRKGEYPPTGLPGEEDESFLREATVGPLVALYRMAGRRIVAEREKVVG
jgi:sterol desaturase/sphingolipid hydroxylase (fatty acid hydroxylase superfamily)